MAITISHRNVPECMLINIKLMIAGQKMQLLTLCSDKRV